MVKLRLLLFTVFIASMLVSIVSGVSIISSVDAQQRQYHLEHEWSKIWINQTGSIDLFYDMNLTLDSGLNINFVYVGQPQSDFTIGPAFDQYGNKLSVFDASSGTDYKVRVNLNSPLTAGQTIRFNLTTNVANMIYEDTQNRGNVGMQFIPSWWSEAPVLDLQVQIVLPAGVTTQNVKTSVDWNGTLPEDDRLAVYWERRNLAPNQKYTFGVSFPKQFVQQYVAAPTFWHRYGLGLTAFGIIIAAVVGVVYVVRKRPYLMPKISMETLGFRRGLTAVEASYLLDMKPTMIVTEMLYSLLQKRAVWVEDTSPSLKMRIMPEFQSKASAEETRLRYYEIDFLKAIKDDGTLDEEKLAQTVTFLARTTEEKLRGYCRRDTIDYYRSIASEAWEQVEQAGTPELASKTYDEQLLWLFLDPNYSDRTKTAFRNRPFEPNPLWFWYWYGYMHYNPHPTYKPSVDAPAQAGKPPTIPGADFANNIATSLEKTSSNIVVNIEKFANAIVPMPAAQKASSEPAHHAAGCVCACAACACACACVSCACACAGGGVG